MKIDNNQLLRFITSGNVDDGKSTLIGRLLYDSKSIYEDQLQNVKRISKRKGNDEIDLTLFTDGLRDEWEQGITIDVAYQYFTTPKRKFIIADTPGHVQYTRNMFTGASTANLAIILVDVRYGVTEQTKRHSFIASLLKIPNAIVCINKMDLVNFSKDVYDTIVNEFKIFSSKLSINDIRFIPMSALLGDNVVDKSSRMEWYKGDPLLHTLEIIPINNDINEASVRFPIQTILRPQNEVDQDYRRYVGRLASGVLRKGDEITVLPSGLTSKVKTIYKYDKDMQEVFAPMSISIALEDNIDISRGDMIVKSNNKPNIVQDIEVMLCWLHTDAAKPRAKYFIKQTTNEQKAIIKEIIYKIDIKTLEKDYECEGLKMNDICKVKLKITKPLMVDLYKENRITGSLILIDETTNETVAAAMVV
ncbi:Bifunctional enzyme CysN/CysC [Kordia antarctica]|uniref:sulfate adenylyltransferase n=1 Tax=Kordia antarctica TaxID=1218801 RepID=A0A7L4ZGA2_9FLAO|nr:GTP-binding protein [Kordia antarctica]QHI35459.1 Bifunctional enzyme CysN/CysC [Kordia antarctica]